MQAFQLPFDIRPGALPAWPSKLPTRDHHFGSTTFIDHPMHGCASNIIRGTGSAQNMPHKVPAIKPPYRGVVRGRPKLLPRSTGSKPIVVTSPEDDKKIAFLLKRKRIKRTTQCLPEQPQILADILGGEEAIWQLASIMLPGTSQTQLNGCPNSWVTVHIQAKVFCIDFIESQQVCFRLTPGTIESLVDHHRNVYCENVRAQCSGNAAIDADIKKLTSSFELAVNSFVFRVKTCCLEDMQSDGSGELDSHYSSQAKAAILQLLKAP